MSISIHAAREGGDLCNWHKCRSQNISIHAAREGGDPFVGLSFFYCGLFQSTPPVKAATEVLFFNFNVKTISIHAAREGGDSSGMSFPNKCNISIHAAREGGDRKQTHFCVDLRNFNPRRP